MALPLTAGGLASQDPAMAKRWTPKEDSMLVWYWGPKPPAYVARKLGRTVEACRRRMRLLCGSSGSHRGMQTQTSLAKETGYFRKDIRRAARALGIRVATDGTRTWRINAAQVDKILAWLRDESVQVGGKSQREVAALLGCTGQTVRAWCVELGIKVEPGMYELSDEDVAALRVRARLHGRCEAGKIWAPWAGFRACVECGTVDTPHKARGLCRRCYGRIHG